MTLGSHCGAIVASVVGFGSTLPSDEPAGREGEVRNDRPNTLVSFGDDGGIWNVGAYAHGMLGRTPNIDRIADEGMRFTDHHAQPSCTPRSAAFITGQLPIRAGMTTIGIPGSTLGLQADMLANFTPM